MIRSDIRIDQEKCRNLARQIFRQNPGINERMMAEAERVLAFMDDSLNIRGISIYLPADEFQMEDDRLTAGDGSIRCAAFSRIRPESLKGLYIYILTAGDYIVPDDSMMTQLYGDFWGSALIDAARIIMKEDLEQEGPVSDSFGPGFYGMEMEAMTVLDNIVDFSQLGIEVTESLALLPVKSCAGLIFRVDDNYEAMPPACESCKGDHRSCQLCQMGR